MSESEAGCITVTITYAYKDDAQYKEINDFIWGNEDKLGWSDAICGGDDLMLPDHQCKYDYSFGSVARPGTSEEYAVCSCDCCHH